MTFTGVTNVRTGELIAVAAAEDDQQQVAPLTLSHRVGPAGEVIADIGGELDIATSEMAVSYVRDVIDHHRGLVVINLAGLEFCDARGLSALLRMANHAEQAGCPFTLASPGPPLVKLLRITGLDRRLLPPG
jgi:anti-sigma B factor antagonist